MYKIYLAGQDVFRNINDKTINNNIKLCYEYGFIPIDPSCVPESPLSIFKKCINEIDTCDIIIANLNPFRGKLVDDGTSFEIGYGYSKKKIIFGYTQYCNTPLINQYEGDEEFPIVESMGNCVNSMLYGSIINTSGCICENLEECLKIIKKII